MAEFDKVTEIPVLLTSGDSVEMELGLSVDYPAGVYAMELTARLNGGSGAGADILSVTFAASGTLQTGTLDTAANKWWWQEFKLRLRRICGIAFSAVPRYQLSRRVLLYD